MQVNVSATKCGACLCWLIAVALVTWNTLRNGGNDNLGVLGMLFGVAAGTLQVRNYFHLARQREQKAFEMGREVERRLTLVPSRDAR